MVTVYTAATRPTLSYLKVQVVSLSKERFEKKMIKGTLKKHSIFKDIIQIEVDPPPPTLFLTNLFLTKC